MRCPVTGQRIAVAASVTDSVNVTDRVAFGRDVGGAVAGRGRVDVGGSIAAAWRERRGGVLRRRAHRPAKSALLLSVSMHRSVRDADVAFAVVPAGAVSEQLVGRSVAHEVHDGSAGPDRPCPNDQGRRVEERDLAARGAHRDRPDGVRRGQWHGAASAVVLLDEIGLARRQRDVRQGRHRPARPCRGGVLDRPAIERDRGAAAIEEFDEVVRVGGSGVAAAAVDLADDDVRRGRQHRSRGTGRQDGDRQRGDQGRRSGGVRGRGRIGTRRSILLLEASAASVSRSLYRAVPYQNRSQPPGPHRRRCVLAPDERPVNR